MAPFRRERACASIGYVAMMVLFVASAAQPVVILPPAAAAVEAGAGAAECRLDVAGGEGRITRAGMSCAVPQPTIALASHLEGFERGFTGVDITSSCTGSAANTSSCLLTICSGRLVLRASRLSGVRGIPLEAVVCVVGSSRLEVHNSSFSHNLVRPLAVFDQAHLLLNASAIYNNSVKGSGGGLLIEGGASVTIAGRSRVHGNNATQDGGGLVARGRAVLMVDGSSSVRDNSAGHYGGGLAAFGNVSITITGDSSVQGNVARNMSGGALSLVDDIGCVLMGASCEDNNTAAKSGGGLYVTDNATVTLSNGSSVHNNTAVMSGGGLNVVGNATVTLSGGSSVHSNTAAWGGGLYAVRNATVTLSDGSSVHSNTADILGGGLLVVNATVRISDGSSVYNNTADEAGGGLAVFFDTSVTFSNGSSVHSNTAGFGGGLSAVGNATVTLSNGSSVHSNNATGEGGGLAVGVDATVTLCGGSRVHGNTAAKSGGGLAVTGATVTLSDGSSVYANTCSGGGRDGQGGGGIAVVVIYDVTMDASGRVVGVQGRNESYSGIRSHVSINNSTVKNNTSIRSPGGGLAVGGNGTVELVNGSVLSQNTARSSSGGGAMLYGNGSLHVDESVAVVDNAVSKGYVGSTIAAFDNSTLHLPSWGNLTKCSAGVYLGQSTCQAGEVRQHDMCVCCQQHTFSFTNGSCEPCPRNGNCTGGSLVQPLPGYWSSAPTSVQMHRCPLSTTACNFRVVNASIQQCNSGFTGPLCGACQLGPVEHPEYGMLSPFRCGKCLQPKKQLAGYLLLSFVSVVFVTYTVHATWQGNLSGDQGVRVTALIKVLVQYLQYTAIIGSVAVPWPLLGIQRWFQAVNIVFAVGSGQALSLDCWLHHYIPHGRLPIAMQRQLVYFVAPVCVLLAVMALQWLSWALGRWVMPLVWRRNERRAQQPALLVLRKLPVTLLVLAYYAYPTLVRAALSFFACLRIDSDVGPTGEKLPPGASAPLNHAAGYWVNDINQACFTGYHKGWALGLGLPSILLWCIAVPVAMGLGLFLCRARADTDSFREHFGFLYRSYRPERVWWEAVWAARTVVLTLISVFAFPMERYFSVLSLLVVFWMSAALQIICQPYAFPKLHRMHMVSTSCLSATTLGALAMFAYELQDSAALKLRIAIAVLVLLVNVAFVCWCSWQLLPDVKEWCIDAYSMGKSQVLQVVEEVLERAGHSKVGRHSQGAPRRHRGDGGSCNV